MTRRFIMTYIDTLNRHILLVLSVHLLCAKKTSNVPHVPLYMLRFSHIFRTPYVLCVCVGNVSWYITRVCHLIESMSLELREVIQTHYVIFISTLFVFKVSIKVPFGLFSFQ